MNKLEKYHWYIFLHKAIKNISLICFVAQHTFYLTIWKIMNFEFWKLLHVVCVSVQLWSHLVYNNVSIKILFGCRWKFHTVLSYIRIQYSLYKTLHNWRVIPVFWYIYRDVKRVRSILRSVAEVIRIIFLSTAYVMAMYNTCITPQQIFHGP